MLYAEAIRLFQQVMALKPADHNAFQNLAVCYLYLGKAAQAIELEYLVVLTLLVG
ncbi:tetratricopeptide repeat protein [Hymenobacter canadensis]|uniref:tetratricopeptide repeat protein n=1 Tax=Hymenobacter canadensis TaxID=2999067 RepID=UPI003313A9C8